MNDSRSPATWRSIRPGPSWCQRSRRFDALLKIMASVDGSGAESVLTRALAWVEQGKDRYRGQMGVCVKPRGKLGATYMTLIRPFRHLVVYPALVGQVGRAWQARPA